MSKTVTAHAEITITIQAAGLGTWGTECTMDQILKQAEEAALRQGHKTLAPGVRAKIEVSNITVCKVGGK